MGSVLFRILQTKQEKMKTFIAISCLLALAAAVPAPQYTSKYNKPYQKNSGGYKEDTYKQTGKKECETHYKTVYKTVIETQKIKKCEDVPEKVCNYIKEKVCHQEPEHKTGYWQGTHGYNKNYHHKPEVCHYENKHKCMEEHKNVCHYDTVKVPMKEPTKVPETICSYQKHHSYGK